MTVPEGRTVHAHTDESAIHFDLMLYGDAYTDGEVEGAGWALPLRRQAMTQPLDHAVIYGPQWDADRRANLKALFP